MGSSDSLIERFRAKWFAGPPDRLPFILGGKRIYVLPTRHGILFLIVLAGMLMGSVNYNNNLGFLLTFLLGGMAFVSVIHTYRNLSGAAILSARAKPVFAGERAVFEFLVRADNQRPLIDLRFALKQLETASGDLTPGDDCLFMLSVPTEKRGLLNPGPLYVSTIYPLGLFKAWSRISVDVECPVYPKPLPSPHEPSSTDSQGREEGAGTGPGVDDFQGLRAYQPGDPLQRIYWKSFSRGMGLYTKSFVGILGTSVLLDWKVLKHGDPERKLSWLCDMVLKADWHNLAYGLSLPGRTIQPGRGNAHKHKCLKSLAGYELPAKKE